MSPATSSEMPDTSAPPYKRSYVEALLAWIDRLPGPTGLWFLGATLLFLVLGTTLSWLDGTIAPGTFSTYRIINDSYTFYPLLVMGYLNRTARRALDEFRPALGALEPRFAQIGYELTTMRRPFAVLATITGVAYIVLSLVGAPASYGLTPTTSLANEIFIIAEGAFSGILFVVFIFFALRQLAVVVRLHRDATNVSLYETGSHNAFSRLTLRTSIGLALPVYVYSFIALVTGETNFDTISFVDIVAIGVMIAGATVLFVWPLYGMHGRLVREKARVLLENARRFEESTIRLHASTHETSAAELDAINTRMSTVILERDVVRKISTWPWEMETLRGFLSSIALPIVLWLATTLLGKFFV